MFWSKIWFALVAIAAAAAITVALVMPRPAERTTLASEGRQLRRACTTVDFLLRDNARARIQIARRFAHVGAPANHPKLRLDEILYQASKGSIISSLENATARQALSFLLNSSALSGTKPDFVILLDAKGRVVGRAGLDAKDYGDSMAGYHLVDDALAGYMRDDLWLLDGTLYQVTASPVITSQSQWAGAVVLGYAVDKNLADRISQQLEVSISFYVAGQQVATSTPVEIQQNVLAQFKKTPPLKPGKPLGSACGTNKLFNVKSSGSTYTALISPLPGEAGMRGGFYTVFAKRAKAVGLAGTLKAVKRGDLSPSRFPWISVSLLLLAILAVGITLMILETDRPLRKLGKDAVGLAKGEADRLHEESHRGKFGSIARSVNIAIDKREREAKAARKDLDQLLGPVPDDLGAASPLPAAAPGGGSGPVKPPPPSEFKFGGAGQAAPAPVAAPDPLGLGLPPAAPGAPAAKPAAPAPLPGAPPRPISLPKEQKAPPPVPIRSLDRTPPPIPVPKDKPKPPPKPAADAITDDILDGGPASKPAPRPPSAPPPSAPPPPARAASDSGSSAQTDFDSPTKVVDPSQALIDASREDEDEHHFHQIFGEFVALKKKCGESTETLTFEKFAKKLRSNRDALMAKHGCKSVRFQVYIKDGKAALKASPVKG